jgi:hypothetical protein
MHDIHGEIYRYCQTDADAGGRVLRLVVAGIDQGIDTQKAPFRID